MLPMDAILQQEREIRIVPMHKQARSATAARTGGIQLDSA